MLFINKVNTFKLLSALIFSLLSSVTLADDDLKPDWYGNLAVKPGFIYGYGNAENRQKAKQQALSEISESIEVKVTGSSSQQTSVKDDDVTQQSSREIKLQTNQKLKQVIKLKEQATEDRVFVAYAIDLRPSELRIAEKLRENLKGPIKINWEGAPWLTSSNFVEELTKNINSKKPIENATEKDISIKLHRQNDQWILLIDNSVHIIWIEDLQRLFAWNNTDPQNFHLKLTHHKNGNELSSRLKEGQKFIIKLTNKEGRPGYYTLFNIYPDGRIVLMQESHMLAKTHEFPSAEVQAKGYSLSAQLAEPGKAGVDIFLALRTPSMIDTLEYQKVQEFVATGNNAFRLHKFLDFLNRTQINDIATIRVKISPL